MTPDAVWATGLAATVDASDSSEAIFALDPAREPLLIEDSDALSLPELVLP